MAKLPRTAMLFAAGLGKRLRPLTLETPKPLINVHDKPIMEYSLDALAKAGVEKVVINSHHLHEQIEHYIRNYNGSLKLLHSHEETLLETGGGLAKAKQLLGDEPFFCINGDIIWQDNEVSALHALADAYDDTLNGTLLLMPVKRAIGYEGEGDFSLKKTTLIRSPKPCPYVFTGVQILHPRLLDNAPVERFSLSKWYKEAEQPDGHLAQFSAIAHKGAWLHIGDEEGLRLANQFLRSS